MGRLASSAILVLTALIASPLHGQTQSDRRPLAFEVASVKPNTSGDVSVSMTPSPGGITIRNYTLQFLLRAAYRIQDFQIVNGPEWLTTTRFDLIGKTVTASGQPEIRIMLQALLMSRFKLRVHTETRELPVYELKIARSDGTFGPRLHSPSRCQNGGPSPCDNKVLAGSISGAGIGMQALAVNLSVFLGRTVIDRTSFTGTFDCDLTWTPEFLPQGLSSSDAPSGPPADPTRPPLPTALQDQLGLKLESTKGPVDVLVIDHVEHPTPD